MRALLSIGLFACLSLGVSGCAEETPPSSESSNATIPFRQDGSLAFLRGPDTLSTVAIEIARTDSARARGLMGRPTLPEDSGMLFVFPDETPQGFWMGDTPLSLDLFFADADSQIVHIAKYARPYSPEQIDSGRPAQYVVELPAGYADSEGIVEGDRLRWTDRSAAN